MVQTAIKASKKLLVQFIKTQTSRQRATSADKASSFSIAETSERSAIPGSREIDLPGWRAERSLDGGSSEDSSSRRSPESPVAAAEEDAALQVRGVEDECSRSGCRRRTGRRTAKQGTSRLEAAGSRWSRTTPEQATGATAAVGLARRGCRRRRSSTGEVGGAVEVDLEAGGGRR